MMLCFIWLDWATTGTYYRTRILYYTYTVNSATYEIHR